ncbi:hypothetical protein M3638_01435 [Oceanobacillus profundus]|uniref:hypothetical protein n=1 Tax=Oceanobacillus profundus TaxID=372463 RepID=UPI0020404AF5|nr:hypothetical protein [Oceanobacillus profundus]MCM3396497.1 hypothetical protein [Oceanobacillus profundus]
MTDEKELDNMPIWQNHEQRITTLEVTMTGISSKMDSVEKTVKDGNDKAERKLDTIDNRLMDEFFQKKRTTHENKWALIGKLLGAGGIIYLLFDLVVSKLI